MRTKHRTEGADEPAEPLGRPARQRPHLDLDLDEGHHTIDEGEIIDRFMVFEPLRTDNAAFQAVRVGDSGGCVQWTEAMELPADALWRLKPEPAENDA